MGLGAIAIVDADGDGAATLAELATVPVAGLGCGVASYADVTDLHAIVVQLTRTLGHVDGEAGGHFEVQSRLHGARTASMSGLHWVCSPSSGFHQAA